MQFGVKRLNIQPNWFQIISKNVQTTFYMITLGLAGDNIKRHERNGNNKKKKTNVWTNINNNSTNIA